MAFRVNNNECKAGGIIAYTKKNEKIYFLMINNSKKEKYCDKITNFYEDPGGKFEKSDSNLISGMCREFEEETCLSYYQFNNDLKINLTENTNNLITESSLNMSRLIKNKLKLIFLPKSKYALGFLEVDPNFMDLKIKKCETLTDKEKKENRSLEWIKSDKFLYKKLHPRLFYNKNLIVDFLKEEGLVIESSPVSSPTRKTFQRRKSESFFRDDSSSNESTPVSSPTRRNFHRRNSNDLFRSEELLQRLGEKRKTKHNKYKNDKSCKEDILEKSKIIEKSNIEITPF
jgi:hypothetical protein